MVTAESSYLFSDDAPTLEDPELKHNEIRDFQISKNDAKEITEYLNTQQTPSESPRRSNIESLDQLSSQLDSLVTEDIAEVKSHTTVLENRNQELAALLHEEKTKTQQLESELAEYKAKLRQVSEEARQSLLEQEQRVSKELGPLQEQLQYRTQELGLLVAEKTELLASLNQSQLVAKQKTSECAELQGRLNTSRARVADLEKDLATAKAQNARSNQTDEEYATLKRDLAALKEQKEEAALDLSELREKFNHSASENLRLQHEVQELTSQVSLANVKILQLSTGETVQNETQVEDLVQRNLLLEKQVADLTQTVKTVTNERDQASVQYQQYAQQLSTQLSNIAQKLEATSLQKEALVKREQDLVKHIGDLEKHLQNLQDEHVNLSTSWNGGLKKEYDEALETINQLRNSKELLEVRCGELNLENEDLLKEMAVKKEAMEALEGQLERLQGNHTDSAKILAVMESQNVAASIATTQNAQLKKQLEDMEEVFIKMVRFSIISILVHFLSKHFSDVSVVKDLNNSLILHETS